MISRTVVRLARKSVLSISGPIDCTYYGRTLLNQPSLNKGSAFPQSERDTFRLNGLLPSNVNTLGTHTLGTNTMPMLLVLTQLTFICL